MRNVSYIGLFLIACFSALAGEISDGDIIFQSSRSRQAEAISAATDSKYTHVGIIFHDEGSPYVHEAVQPVRKIPLKEWIRRGKDGHFVIKRVKDIDTATLPEVRKEVERMIGKDYDLLFEWSDSRIYCSELVWKAYDRASDIQIGELKKLGDFDLNHEVVRPVVARRYGGNVPVEMKVIAPSEMFDSKLLITVRKN